MANLLKIETFIEECLVISDLSKFNHELQIIYQNNPAFELWSPQSRENFTINLKVPTEIWHIQLALRFTFTNPPIFESSLDLSVIC